MHRIIRGCTSAGWLKTTRASVWEAISATKPLIRMMLRTYYHAPVSFPSHYITTTQDVGNNTTRHSFDFWMVENKHTGREGTTEYNHREVKANTTGEYPLYTALTGDSWTPNNLASYVTIYCNVTYKEEPKVDDNGQITDSGSPVYRMGVVEYTIHLGYIGDNTVAEETKARDFNSYRNTKLYLQQ